MNARRKGMRKKINSILALLMTALLVLSDVPLPALAGDEAGTVPSADAAINWPEPTANWYEAYQHTKDDANHILYLKRYKKDNTAEYIVVPGKTTIGAYEYTVVLDSDPLAESADPYYTNSLWGPGYETLKGIKFVNGVKAKSCKELFHNMTQLEVLDLSGLDTAGVTDMTDMFQSLSKVETLDVSGFDTSSVTSMNAMFYGCSALTSLDLSHFDTSKVTDMQGMFYFLNLQTLNLSNFDTSNVTDMAGMFNCNEKLISLDLSSFNTSNVTNMQSMFERCFELTAINFGEHFDTSKVETMDGMFWSCSKLAELDLSGFNTAKVETFNSMFNSCSALKKLDIKGFDTAKARDMRSMFEDCGKLTQLEFGPGFDTSSVENMEDMFCRCVKLMELDLSGFDTSKVENMSSMFSECDNLRKIRFGEKFSTAKVERMRSMFRYCWSLESLDLSGFDTSNVTDMMDMFIGCANLAELDVSKFNTSKVEDMDSMFQQCSGLRQLDVSGFDTSQVKDMECLFRGCVRLQSIDLHNFNTEKVTEFYQMFYNCPGLKVADLRSFDFSNGDAVSSGIQSFLGGSGIQHLYLPVKALSGFDFADDTAYDTERKLSDVYYAGTQEQWNALGNNLPEGVTLHCGWTDPAVEPTPDETIKVSSITWAKEELNLQQGKSDWVSWKVLPEDATDKSLRDTSSNPSVAYLGDYGIIALNPGTTTITLWAQDGSGVSADLVVNVAASDKKFVTKITLNKNNVNLKVGDTETLTATVEPADAEDKRIEWSSDKEAVATVDQSGKVKAIAKGTAYIYARAKDGSDVSGYCIVNVGGGSEPGPGPVEPSEPIPGSGEATDPQPVVENVASQSLTLVKGQKFLLADKDWKLDPSAAKGVVSVSKGNVTAKKAGTVTLKRGSGENEQTLALTVLAPVIEKTEKTLKLEAGAGAQLSFSGKKAVDGMIAFTDTDSLPVRFVSAAPDVATVDGDGNVSALTKGNAAITAYINGVAFKFTVKVSEQASALTRTVHLNLTKTKNVKIKGLAKTEWVLEEGSEEGVVDIIKGSKVKALTPGTVTLKCGDYTMTVIAEDPSISGSSKPYAMKEEMKIGETKPVSLKAVEQDVFFKSSKSSVAYMDAEGVIHARSKGKAKLSAKVNGRTVSITVTVK